MTCQQIYDRDSWAFQCRDEDCVMHVEVEETATKWTLSWDRPPTLMMALVVCQ